MIFETVTPERAAEYAALSGVASDTEGVTSALNVALNEQEHAVVLPTPPAPGEIPSDLAEAVLRRMVHVIALRTLPLGFQVAIGGDGGIPIRVGGPDREVTRLETPYRRRFCG